MLYLWDAKFPDKSNEIPRIIPYDLMIPGFDALANRMGVSTLQANAGLDQ